MLATKKCGVTAGRDRYRAILKKRTIGTCANEQPHQNRCVKVQHRDTRDVCGVGTVRVSIRGGARVNFSDAYLVLGGIADQTFRVGECNVRRRGAVSLIVGDDLDTAHTKTKTHVSVGHKNKFGGDAIRVYRTRLRAAGQSRINHASLTGRVATHRRTNTWFQDQSPQRVHQFCSSQQKSAKVRVYASMRRVMPRRWRRGMGKTREEEEFRLQWKN